MYRVSGLVSPRHVPVSSQPGVLVTTVRGARSPQVPVCYRNQSDSVSVTPTRGNELIR